MIYHRCRRHSSLLMTHGTQRMITKEQEALTAPSAAVDTGRFVHVITMLTDESVSLMCACEAHLLRI